MPHAIRYNQLLRNSSFKTRLIVCLHHNRISFSTPLNAIRLQYGEITSEKKPRGVDLVGVGAAWGFGYVQCGEQLMFLFIPGS